VNAHQLADAARGGGSGVGSGLDGANVSADDRRHEPGIDLLPADEDDIRGFHHRIGRLDHADEPARLDHPEGIANLALVFVSH